MLGIDDDSTIVLGKAQYNTQWYGNVEVTIFISYPDPVIITYPASIFEQRYLTGTLRDVICHECRETDILAPVNLDSVQLIAYFLKQMADGVVDQLRCVCWSLSISPCQPTVRVQRTSTRSQTQILMLNGDTYLIVIVKR